MPASFVPSAAWGGTGFVVDMDGPVHWVDFGGPDDVDRPPIVLVHGLGGSHLDWVGVAPALAEQTRVVAIDLAGFGLTPSAGRSTSVEANADLLHRFLREVVGRPAVLVGNSMGGMISVLHTSAHPDTVVGVVLVDPSLPQTFRMLDKEVALMFLVGALPVIGARLSRRADTDTPVRVGVNRVLDLCFADPTRVDPKMVDAAVSLVEHRLQLPPEDESFRTAARSLMKVTRHANRYRAKMARIPVPVLLVHGERDRLVALAAADVVAAANPRWKYSVLDDVGHTPQLEVPARFLGIVSEWLHGSGVFPPRSADRDRPGHDDSMGISS